VNRVGDVREELAIRAGLGSETFLHPYIGQNARCRTRKVNMLKYVH
jgi:hypothetical protein